ncbi:MAG: M1 family metallopeptidase [Chloroflexota bacterium]
MRKIIASFLTFCLLAACGLFSTPTPVPPTATPIVIPPDDFSLFADGLVASAKPILDNMDGATLYEIEFVIDDDLVHIAGSENVRFTNREDVPLDEIQFRLYPNILGGDLHVDEVRVDGQALVPAYRLDDSLLAIPLPQPLAVGQSVNIEMDFDLAVPTELESNYGVLASYDGVLTLAHAYPMIEVYDDEGWNAEIPSSNGDLTYGDMAFFVVTVDAPKELTIVGAGIESQPEFDDDRGRVTFAAGPVRDFFLAASADYEVVSRTVGEVTVNSYAPAELEEGARFAMEAAVRAIEVFGKGYAPYPYTEFDIVATPTYALGVEYPGATAITRDIYELGGTRNDAPVSIYLESTVVHEVGHQWFYNLVGNDQLDDPWLDESLVQYITWQYYLETYGESGAAGFEASLNGRWGRVNFEPIPIGLPVAEYSGTEYSAIVYGRGPFFFEALQDEIGSEAFDAFIRDYTETYSWGIATSEGLQSLAEEHCACELDDLFAEWVYP